MVIILGLDNSLMFSIKVAGLKSEEFKKKNKKNKSFLYFFIAYNVVELMYLQDYE